MYTGKQQLYQTHSNEVPLFMVDFSRTNLKPQIFLHFYLSPAQNIRVISNYYTRINLNRLCELLKLPADQTEEYLSQLANDKALTVKIDRPSGIIHFSTKKATSDVLNDWAFDITKLMNLVNKTCHLIHKEECINNVLY